MDKTKEVSYEVVKSNELIQYSRFDLTAVEQKSLLYIISKIKPDDAPDTVYTLSVSRFIHILGMNNSGPNYQNIRNAIKSLADKSVWLTIPGEKRGIRLSRWIDTAEIYDGRDEIRVTIHSSMRPYLMQLLDCYTQYILLYALALQSKYSIRLYELLASYRHQQARVFMKLDDFKLRLNAQSYTRMTHLKARVLEPAVSEINEITDIHVEYKLHRTSRAFTDIELIISRPDQKAMYYNQQYALYLLSGEERKR